MADTVLSLLQRHEALFNAASKLIPPPEVTLKLAEVICHPDVTVDDVAEVVGSDPGLATLVLREANSAFHTTINGVDTINGAVMRIGTGRVLAAALGDALAANTDGSLPAYGMDAASFRRHGVLTSIAAEAILRHRPDGVGRDVIAAALIHDLGKTVLADFLDPVHTRDSLAAGADVIALEREQTATDHPAAGAFVVESWNLPRSLAMAIEWHHDPHDNSPARVINIASWIAEEITSDGDLDPSQDPTVEASLAGLGLADSMDRIMRAVYFRVEKLGED